MICRSPRCVWIFLALLAACHGDHAGGRSGSQAAMVADSRGLLDAYIAREAGIEPTKADADLRKQLAVKLAKLQAAAAKGESVQGVQARSELARLEVLAHAGADAAGVYAAPAEAELKQAYVRYLQTLPASEYHAAHILVATEARAMEVIEELGRGADFADLATSESADDSKARGGDLGWIRPGHLPAEIFAALESLDPGDYSKRPVNTAYGWHVIRLLERKPAVAAPFEHVKSQIAASLQQERYQRFLDQSLADLNVELGRVAQQGQAP